MDSLEARLSYLRSSSGLLVYESQTQELTKGYVRLLTRGGTQAQKEEVLSMMKELRPRVENSKVSLTSAECSALNTTKRCRTKSTLWLI
ncbi:MAG: hypothetical protein IPP33_06170 [Flavobacteriales bacterium]|nr:hypothetical protein [Flavobacteriales bacterium]